MLGQRLGLDMSTMLDVISVSTGQNDSASRSIPKIIDGSFRRTFSLGLFTKDVKITTDLAASLGIPAPIANVVHARMAEAIEEFGRDVDHTVAFQLWSGAQD